jgi:acyl-CoA synthetase (NDP forming)
MNIASSDLIAVDRALAPRSVAIVGAAPESGTMTGYVLSNLEAFEYPGQIHLVSRSRAQIGKHTCLGSIEELPHGVDVVVLCVPEAVVVESVAACGRKGVNTVIIYSSGFAETGPEGKANQDRLAEVAQQFGVNVLGPNCMGLTSFVNHAPLTFEGVEIRPGPDVPGIGVITQSGAMAANIRDALAPRAITITHVVSTGNEAVLGLEDFLGHLVAEDRTRVIVLFAEQIRRPQQFMRLAQEARRRGKPIVMMMPGRSARARDAAQSHTGALADDHAVIAAQLAGQAVIMVDSLDELFDVAAILLKFPEPSKNGLMVITNSGAMKGVALDFCDALGIPLAALSPPTEAALRALMPAYAPTDNPLDTTTLGLTNPARVGEMAKVMLDDPACGSMMVALSAGPRPAQKSKSQHIISVLLQSPKPVAITIVGDNPLIPELSEPIRNAGFPFFRSPDRAMRALGHVARYGRLLEAARVRPSPRPVSAPKLPGRGVLPEYRGKAWLGQLGIAIPQGGLARDVERAVKIAAEIGYPVAIKAQAAALAHKSDVGGVIIGLEHERALRDAWTTLHDNVGRARPGLVLDGVLVERKGPRGLEMVIGAKRDPNWGPVLMAGIGGIWIEAIADVFLLPPDAAKQEAIDALGNLKAAALLKGIRGAPAVDVGAVGDAVLLLGGIMRSVPEIDEIDINPLVVYPKGVLALDALIVTR